MISPFVQIIYRLAIQSSSFINLEFDCAADNEEIMLALRKLVQLGVVNKDEHGVFSVNKFVEPGPGLKRFRSS